MAMTLRRAVQVRMGLVTLGVAAVAATTWWMTATDAPDAAPLETAEACPPGYKLTDPKELAEEFQGQLTDEQRAHIDRMFGDSESVCRYRRFPETMAEVGQWGQAAYDAAAAPNPVVPVGAYRAAVETKAAMMDLQAKVDNAAGSWQEYGSGPQVSDQRFADGSRDGIETSAGRVDDFAYDDVRKRLFVAVGTGGVWMSEAVDGDVATLGDHWVSIGDNMPSLIASAVAWTEAQGGRVLALSGEHVQGGNTYTGLGAFWTDDLGATWHQAAGIPDGAGASTLAVDLGNPNIVYAATHRGLFRSDDAGETYVNVSLPVSEECAGVFTTSGPCQLANVVSDVVIKQPGGLELASLDANVCSDRGCPVLAAVGYRAGHAPYADGTPMSPSNGLYRSETGEPGTWERLDGGSISGLGLVPEGFAPQERIGRLELGVANGPEQDHNIVYAIVQDAVLFNDGIPVLDLPTEEENPQVPLDCTNVPNGDPRFVCDTVTAGFNPTAINGIYVSTDFGSSWTRIADDVELTYNVTTGSTLAAVVPLGIGPGVQAWYDLWIQPDPFLADSALAAPTRIAFGMEEIWMNRLSGLPTLPGGNDNLDNLSDDEINTALGQLIPVVGAEQTNNDFKVIGTYFAGETCLFLLGNIGPPQDLCPTYDGVVNGTTTHPDQHDGIFIKDDIRGGTWLFAGNDGGVFKQYSSNPITDNFDNTKWGAGANQGFYTLMNYGIDVSGDGTVWYGLQDNASGKIEPNTRRVVRTYVGDGVWTAAHPTNSNIAYVQTPGLSIVRTRDGGVTHDYVDPDGDDPTDTVGVAHFLSPFMMDPQNPEHLVASGSRVAEIQDASTGGSGSWVTVFDLGVDEATGALHQTRHRPIDVEGANVYVGWCGPCTNLSGDTPFQRGIATNVGGAAKPRTGTPDGWHQASLNGLPNRFIYGVEMDKDAPETVYVTLGGYSTARWIKPGGFLDENAGIGSGHVFKSTDAGENFVDISGNLPDTNVTAIVKRGNQLIVGTDIGVFISSDLDGTEWAPLGDLPNVPVNQLVLQPGNDANLFAGTFGRGVQLYEFELTTEGRGNPGISGFLSSSRGGALGWASLFVGLILLGRRRRMR